MTSPGGRSGADAPSSEDEIAQNDTLPPRVIETDEGRRSAERGAEARSADKLGPDRMTPPGGRSGAEAPSSEGEIAPSSEGEIAPNDTLSRLIEPDEGRRSAERGLRAEGPNGKRW